MFDLIGDIHGHADAPQATTEHLSQPRLRGALPDCPRAIPFGGCFYCGAKSGESPCKGLGSKDFLRRG